MPSPLSRRRLLAPGALRLAAAALALATATTAAAAPPASGCRRLAHDGADFTVCQYDLRAYELRLFLADPDGKPYGSLAGLLRSREGSGLAMAMNAGMYHHDLMPVGLFVAEGRELKRLNTAAGPGNFHLKPNGVFFVSQDGKPGILDSVAYAKRRPRVRLATQSGPMLVIDGELHPRFSDEGPSRKYRNGVGIVDANTVAFAISDEPVSFGGFARLFRDELGCRNALFLDGSVSALHAADLGRTDVSLKPLGPLIGVARRGGGPQASTSR